MTELRKREQYAAVFVAVTVISAVIARVLSNLGIFPTELGLFRTTLYIVLYIAWGISIRMRVVQPSARRYLTAVTALLVFWFVVRASLSWMNQQQDRIISTIRKSWNF